MKNSVLAIFGKIPCTMEQLKFADKKHYAKILWETLHEPVHKMLPVLHC